MFRDGWLYFWRVFNRPFLFFVGFWVGWAVFDAIGHAVWAIAKAIF